MRSGTSGTGKSGVLGRWWNRSRNRGRAAEAGLLINAGQFVIIFDGHASQLDLLVPTGFREYVWISFASTSCKRVQVRTEMQEVPVYETVCEE